MGQMYTDQIKVYSTHKTTGVILSLGLAFRGIGNVFYAQLFDWWVGNDRRTDRQSAHPSSLDSWLLPRKVSVQTSSPQDARGAACSSPPDPLSGYTIWTREERIVDLILPGNNLFSLEHPNKTRRRFNEMKKGLNAGTESFFMVDMKSKCLIYSSCYCLTLVSNLKHSQPIRSCQWWV